VTRRGDKGAVPKFTITSAVQGGAEHEATFTVATDDLAAQWPQALRFALLAKCDGVAATALGVVTAAGRAKHAFSELSGVDGSVADLALGLANMRFALPQGQEQRQITFSATGPRQVTGDDLAGEGVEVLTPGVALCSVSPGAALTLEVLLQRGRGDSPVDAQTAGSAPEGLIAINAWYSPVLIANVSVEAPHALRVNVKTDGSISPRAALEHVIATW
jgi:DNA-directed RNA polymerase subunit alpha